LPSGYPFGARQITVDNQPCSGRLSKSPALLFSMARFLRILPEAQKQAFLEQLAEGAPEQDFFQDTAAPLLYRASGLKRPSDPI